MLFFQYILVCNIISQCDRVINFKLNKCVNRWKLYGFEYTPRNINWWSRNGHIVLCLNPLTPDVPVSARTRLHCFKKLQLSRSHEHCLNYQLWSFTRKSFKLRYPINTKISAIFAEYQRLNLDKNKNDRKTTKITFLPSVFFFYWKHHCKPKSQHSQQNSVLVLAYKWFYLLLFVAGLFLSSTVKL